MFENIPTPKEHNPANQAEISNFELERDLNAEEKRALEIIKKLQDNNHEAYFVGGAVRDYLLKKDPKDIDLATSASLEEIQNIFGERAYFIGQQEKHGIIVISPTEENEQTNKNGGIEVAVFRKDIYEESKELEEKISDKQKHIKGRHADRVETEGVTAAEDATRRDLTINALFFNPIKNEIIDYVGGRKDLEDKVIRFAGDPTENIEQDKMRIIRYFRFKGSLGFEENPESAKAIREWLAQKENRENFRDMFHLNSRIKPEMEKILRNKNRIEILEDLMQTGIMELIIPELAQMQKTEQSRKHHSEGNVWEHTKLCLKNLPLDAKEELIWAVLLHDIGKNNKSENGEENNQHFYGHEKISAELIADILRTPSMAGEKGLGFKKDFVETVCYLVSKHMKKMDFLKMKKSKQADLMCNKDFCLLMKLWQIDSMSAIAEDENINQQKVIDNENIANIFEQFQKEVLKKQSNLQKAKDNKEFIGPSDIINHLKDHGWKINNSGACDFQGIAFFNIIPLISQHIQSLYEETEDISKEKAIERLNQITNMQEGLLNKIFSSIIENKQITTIQREIQKSEPNSREYAKHKKELSSKASELFRNLFQEQIKK